ncbi:MAG: hypothetical protein PHX34_05835 [Candidatus Shapirobacteria bacterium]|nr:hypothetical protein [Candidatus Shapirobacteria bacterium]
MDIKNINKRRVEINALWKHGKISDFWYNLGVKFLNFFEKRYYKKLIKEIKNERKNN